MDAAFEIAIAAENGDGDEIVFLDGSADGVGKRAAVADARGAAVADEIEFQFIEKHIEAAGGEVVGDDFRAGRETGFHPRLDLQATLYGFFREQAGTKHQRRVRGVCAARDRGDDDGAAGEIERVAVIFDGGVLRRRVADNFGEARFRIHAVRRDPVGASVRRRLARRWRGRVRACR